MKQLCVTIRVSPAAAVRAGKTQVGDIVFTLNDNALESLSDGQREALARHLDGEDGWREPLSDSAIEVAEANLDSLKKLLEARIEREAARAEAARAEAEQCDAAIARAIEGWKKAPIQQLMQPYSAFTLDLVLSTGHLRWAPGDVTEVVRVSASHPAFRKSIVTMTGRESEREEYIAAMEAKREAEALAQRQERERQEEERRAKLEAARATVRDFLLHHMESEDVNDWFAQLSDHHAAKPEIKHIIMTAIARYLNAQNLSSDNTFAFYDASCGYRYGESSIDDEVSDLSVYRRMRFIQQTIDDALEEDGGMGVVFNVNPVKAWRPADDGDAEDEIDEDGEVPMPDFFRVRCSVGDVTMNLYVS
jgi:hypothetical protein